MNVVVSSEITAGMFMIVVLMNQLITAKTEAEKRLRVTSFLCLFWLAVDITAYELTGPNVSAPVLYAVNALSYAMAGIVLVPFVLYCKSFLSEKARIKTGVFYVCATLCAVNAAAVLYLFTFGGKGTVTNGMFIGDETTEIAATVIPYIISIFMPFTAFLHIRKVGTRTALIFALYVLVPLLGMTVNSITGCDFTVVFSGLALNLFVMLLQMEHSREKLLEEKASAESASTEKTRFLFSMSHDIRTPMNAILGYTDMALRHFDEPERARESLRKIRSSGEHLLSLINDILEISRIESGKMELAEGPMNLHEFVLTAEHMGKVLAVDKSIDFQTFVAEMKNAYVYGDELHLREVIINLISNAVKYTGEDGWVRCALEQTAPAENGVARYRFMVSDNGIGMSEEFQKHLFEAFSRERNATVSKVEGSGIGLSIVKRITDLAGGTIRVESAPGKGTTFVVDLPLRVMNDEEIAAYKAELGFEEEDTDDDVDLAGARVLLVEDNEMNREIAGEILSDAGLVMETAENGEVAVNLVREKGGLYYDYILMDVQMPVMDGLQAARVIRKLPDGGSVPIIALSANAFEEDKKRSLEAGMNAHASKPIDVPKLFETMRHLRRG